MVQEGNFKGAEVCYLPVLKDEGKWGRLPWLNKGFCWDLGKKESLWHLEEGQATQENYKVVMKLCKEKIRRAKVQLKPNLATIVQDNKKMFV